MPLSYESKIRATEALYTAAEAAGVIDMLHRLIEKRLPCAAVDQRFMDPITGQIDEVLINGNSLSEKAQRALLYITAAKKKRTEKQRSSRLKQEAIR